METYLSVGKCRCDTLARSFLQHMPPSHDFNHALAVRDHVLLEVDRNWKANLTEIQQAALWAAAGLHEADDRKYFPLDIPAQDYDHLSASMQLQLRHPNATRILYSAFADMWVHPAYQRQADQLVHLALTAIALTSTHENGNGVPKGLELTVLAAPWLLMVRYADRLEALGKVGIYRCFQFSLERGREYYNVDTPRSRSVKEAMETASPERFRQYQAGKGQSASMVDHYFDKLLHLAAPIVESQFSTLAKLALEKHDEMLRVVLADRPNGLYEILIDVIDQFHPLECASYSETGATTCQICAARAEMVSAQNRATVALLSS